MIGRLKKTKEFIKHDLRHLYRNLHKRITMKTKTFQVSGMTCNGCAGTVSNILNMQPGVEKAEATYPDNIAEVSFDENEISEDRMKEVVKMMGYELLD